MFALDMTIINTSFWLIMCISLAYIVRIIPEKFYEKHWLFKEKSIEKKLFKLIKIHKWKSKLPEMGKVFNFSKKNLEKELSKEYLERFILETYYAELGHLLMIFFGFSLFIFNPNEYMLFSFFCSFLNLFIQLPFCLIQRYNRPRLIRIYNKIKKH